MPKWTKPSEGLPEVDAGDRVIVIVEEADPRTVKTQFRAIILQAAEIGWEATDETYIGYTPEDGVLWTTEDSLCGIARAMKEFRL